MNVHFLIFSCNCTSHIDESELAAALSAGGDRFELSSIKMMVKMFDIDKNGKIDFSGKNSFSSIF
jgi:Ca2+-binding EF-hand superfamily protein